MKLKKYSQFWPYYLSQHLNPVCRALHVVGTLTSLGFVVLAFLLKKPSLVLAGIGVGYAFAWIGHFVFEKNRPATFQQPIYSFLSDFVMLFKILTGQISREILDLQKSRSERRSKDFSR